MKAIFGVPLFWHTTTLISNSIVSAWTRVDARETAISQESDKYDTRHLDENYIYDGLRHRCCRKTWGLRWFPLPPSNYPQTTSLREHVVFMTLNYVAR